MAARAVAIAHRKPLVTMNAGGLAEGIAESELFGHVKGAFTDARVDRIGCFELADEGTLFLDEIANMPVRLQAKLLRVLQTGEVQRVGSSRAALRQRARALGDQRRPAGGDRGRTVPRGPALPAEHRRHPPAAAARTARGHRRRSRAHFLAHYAARYRKPLDGLRRRGASRRWRRTAGPATSASSAHSIERAVLMADPSATRDRGARISACAAQRAAATRRRALSLEEAERVFIEKVLARHGGDVRLAAEQLGMSRSALYRRLQQYGVRE